MNIEKRLYQWDTGQKLVGCTGLYVDFPIDNEVYRVETADGTCIIPDELLQTSGGHKVYECMTNNTIRSFAFSVTPRPMPPNYVFTPTERLTFEGLVQKVDDAVADMIRRAESGEFDGHTPIKGTDYFTASEIQQIQNEVSSGAIGEFKSVVDTETDKFNANATEKVNAYNQNDSEKTTSYNANATEKLNAYNSNAGTKLNAYNTNANNKVAEFDAHTEQIQTDISELKSDLTNIVNVETGINVANPKAMTDGYIKDSDGTISVYTTYKTTEFIPVKQGDRLFVASYSQNGSLAPYKRKIALLYDSNKSPIKESYVNITNGDYIEVNVDSTDAKYIRASAEYDPDTLINRFTVYKANELPPAWEDYSISYINKMNIPRLDVAEGKISTLEHKVEENEARFINENLLIKRNAIDGYYNGQPAQDSNYCYYEKIPVTAGTVYNIYPRARMVYIMTEEETVINYINQDNTKSITANADGFAYVTYYKSDDKHSYMFYEAGKESYPTDECKLSEKVHVPFKSADYTIDELSDKKWCVIGDSFTQAGYSPMNTLSDGKYKGKNKTYQYFVGNRTGIDIIDFSMGGRTLAYPSEPAGFTNSLTCPSVAWYYQNIPSDVDYITIYLGINDSHRRSTSSSGDGEDNTGVIPLGTITDNTTATYYGAWNVVLTWLLEHRPFAHIGIIVSNGCDTIDYRTAQLEIARKYGVPFIDLNGDDRTPAMIRSQNPNIANDVKEIIKKKQAVDWDGSKTGTVNTHPNDDAHEFESYFIETFLRSI